MRTALVAHCALRSLLISLLMSGFTAFGPLLRQWHSYDQRLHPYPVLPRPPGAGARRSGFLLEHGGNIEEAAQYNDQRHGPVLHAGAVCLRPARPATLKAHPLATFAEPHRCAGACIHGRPHEDRCSWSARKATASTTCCSAGNRPAAHRHRAIISNHRDFYQLAPATTFPFHHIPVTGSRKAQAEAKQYEISRAEGAELVVLARYMQILSTTYVPKVGGRAINIHQLPAQLQGRQAVLPGA